MIGKVELALILTHFISEDTYYGVTVDVGFPGGASVGVGLNWGGGQGLSGSVSASYGFRAG